jgi:PAS domain S-box-containing protein
MNAKSSDPPTDTDTAMRSREESGTLAIEARNRTFFELAPDGILIADPHSYYLDANPGICRMLGYTRDELVGLHGSDIVAPGEIRNIDPALEAIKSTSGYQREWTFRRKDGSTFDAEVIATTLPDGNLLAMVRDVTAHKAREHELKRISRLYAALSHINQAIVWKRSSGELLETICEALVHHGGFEMAWIGWHDPSSQRLLPVAVWGDDSGYIHSIDVYADDRPEGRGPSGIAFRSGRPYINNDLINDPTTVLWRQEQERRGLHANAVFPIRANGIVSATLSVYATEPGFFQDKEIALLEEAARDVSFAIDNLARERERQRAEDTARNEKLFSDTMIDSMPGVVYFYDEAGRFLRWNYNFETVSGYAGDEIERMHPLDFFAGEEKRRVSERIAEVFATGESSIEAEFTSKNGTATPYLFTGRRVAFEGKSCLVGVGIDISVRRRALHALEESERKYRELVELANSIILRWNSEGCITYMNEFGQRFFGYSAAEIVGRSVIGTIVPETESSGRDLRQLMDAIHADPDAFRENINENMRRNGERAWIAWTNRVVRDASGRVVELLAIGSDITGLKHTEAALREAELRFHTLFEQTPVGVIVIDPDGNRIVECNDQAAQQLGFTPAQLSGLRLDDIAARLPGIDASARIKKILALGRDEFEIQHLSPKGDMRDVLVSGCVLELGGRKVIHSVFLDITQRKLAERVLQESHERLESSVAARTRELQAALVRAEAADRLKSAFLATMSHEFRTPLNSILGFTGIILQGLAGPLNPEQAKQLGMVRGSARHLLELISDVLDISKIEAGQMEVRAAAFNLRESLERVVASVRPLAEKKGLALDLVIAADVAQMLSDRRRVEQILLNLLNNAIKFTQNGSVTLTAELTDASQSIDGNGSGMSARLRITDTGIGIRPEDLGRLFQPFHQIDSGLTRQHEGTGLGLAICRRLTALLGGDIVAASAWSKGSVFTVTLPLQRSMAA